MRVAENDFYVLSFNWNKATSEVKMMQESEACFSGFPRTEHSPELKIRIKIHSLKLIKSIDRHSKIHSNILPAATTLASSWAICLPVARISGFSNHQSTWTVKVKQEHSTSTRCTYKSIGQIMIFKFQCLQTFFCL